MEKFIRILNNGFYFERRYLVDFLRELVKPLCACAIGILCLCSILLGAKFVLLALLSIPLLCFGFWRGYVVSYCLIPFSYDYIEGEPRNFAVYKKIVSEKKLALYLLFVAVMTIVVFIPSISPLIKIALKSAQMSDFYIVILNALFAAPFLNYNLQAFYFKDIKENYFNLFLNCYSGLDFSGIAFAILFSFIMFYFQNNPILSVLLLLILPLMSSCNTFWYFSKRK